VSVSGSPLLVDAFGLAALAELINSIDSREKKS